MHPGSIGPLTLACVDRPEQVEQPYAIDSSWVASHKGRVGQADHSAGVLDIHPTTAELQVPNHPYTRLHLYVGEVELHRRRDPERGGHIVAVYDSIRCPGAQPLYRGRENYVNTTVYGGSTVQV
jgi:hypothetical protein